ncbi:signal peptide peptidase SppA [Candidatus Woesearchaeota archaeon]|nr:signal peptide peptidase SppA [Candidatus Woesearchaeota archaeon]
MKKKVKRISKTARVLLIIGAVLFVLFFVLPLLFSLFDGSNFGNVAVVSVEGVITANGGGSFGTQTVSAKTVVNFLKDAEERDSVEAVLLEINSPGGSAVASDEIATQIKKMEKPVVAVIREMGASGGYWIASATDHVIANRMSITGSIGVISSYLEFSGLMEEYGVSYERLVAGEHKDIGTPYRKLASDEKEILQSKLNKIHDFFIEEVAENRGLSKEKVKKVATGEFLLGIEALNEGLVDELGDRDTAEAYLKEVSGLKKVNYINYEVKRGLLEEMLGVISGYFFNVGEGIGASLIKEGNKVIWT